jgi:lipopolysaccharide/colanic/teichoic acid biosynthesis glycosyltransferase
MRSAPVKRLLDIISSATLLVLLAPVLLSVAIGVWIDLGRPLFFRQQRPGLHGRPFTLVKFRTMREASKRDSAVSMDERRLTRFGRWLRSTSLDEIPELWNVLRGDMSLVGPRPLLMHYLPLYTQEQMRRHDVRPGLTGWAQVNGRNALSWDDKFKLDVWYVDNQSVLLDARILLLTAGAVVRPSGIAHPGCATMPEFKGPEISGANRKAPADAALDDDVGE